MEYYILYVILNYFIIIITYSWYFPTLFIVKVFPRALLLFLMLCYSTIINNNNSLHFI